jgi:hypothetical protein
VTLLIKRAVMDFIILILNVAAALSLPGEINNSCRATSVQ